jgi:hypothetical protein
MACAVANLCGQRVRVHQAGVKRKDGESKGIGERKEGTTGQELALRIPSQVAK